MREMLLCLMMTVVFCTAGPGCSDKQGEEKEKSAIEEMTEQAGREATEAIKGPINKARGVEALSRERVGEMNAVEDAE